MSLPIEPRVPERNKRPGVCYAVSKDGIELPVIDVTHPAFACDGTEAQLSAMIDEAARGLAIIKSTPPEARRAILEKSLLARGWAESVGSYMSGMITYLNRLGPANLGEGYANAIDRSMAAGLMPLSFRFRLRDLSRLMADSLLLSLRANPALPVFLWNIGGGPAAESLNALILINRENPELLRQRRVSIRVLDVDAEGPCFGARALAALLAEGAPLAGIAADFRHVLYNWSETPALRAALAEMNGPYIGVASSEGALFDYGSDQEIVANLAALRDATPPDFVVVGSVVRSPETLDPRLKPTTEVPGRPLIRYLGLDAFGELAHRAGWRVDRTLDSVAHHAVSLRKAD